MKNKYQYKYCSNCGADFEKSSETLYVCPKCDFRIFINPKPAVGVILYNSKKQILLIKRSYNPGKGMWGLIGGFINPGEEAEDALSREIEEEIGLSIKNFKLFGSYTGTYLYKNIEYKTIDIIYTSVIIDDGKIKLSEEAKQFSFFDIDKIPLDKIAPDDAKKAITELIRSKLH